jgi:hypothetical protein
MTNDILLLFSSYNSLLDPNHPKYIDTVSSEPYDYEHYE